MINFTIEKTDILRALSHIQNVVERRQTVPILSNVLLEVKSDNGGSLQIQATDNELEFSELVPANVASEGAITVPAHKLYDVIKKLPDGAQVQCVQKADQFMVSCGRSRFALPTLDAENFPHMKEEDFTCTFMLTTAQLQGLIDRTQFAMSTEETRYNLNGIFLHVHKADKSLLKAVATDGHRLACSQVELPEGADSMPAVIVPRKTVGELTRLLGELQQDVSVSVCANQIRFSFGRAVLSSRLIDGIYPDYEVVIPTSNDKVMEVDSAAFTSAVDRVAVISERSRGIKLSLKKGVVHLAAAATDEGSAEDELDVAYDASALEVGFNYRYLLDILAQVQCGTARFSFSDASTPVVIQDAQDNTALYVLMPMRV